MAAAFPSALIALSQDLTIHEALSGLFGSICLATWIFLMVPQLILNYKTGSAEGISLAFLCVWLVGDVCNLVGATWAGLIPTAIALAMYFCFSDSVIISQCLYYNFINARRAKRHLSANSGVSEDEPLLSRAQGNDAIGRPGSRRRSSARRPSHGSELRRDSLSKILEDDDGSSGRVWLRNLISILLVWVAGASGWYIAYQSGVWTPTPEHEDLTEPQSLAIGAQVLGYCAALCYLGARIPQIIKNYREKSCEGLALLFFILSITGNATYAAGIIFHSVEKDYLLKNLPWLIGSLGTMVEDGIIFMQFRIYAPKVASSIAVVG